MTHDISKQKQVASVQPFDEIAAREAISTGIRAGTVLDIHSAVEASGARNGGQVQAIFKELKAESDMLSTLADELAMEGKTLTSIVSDLDAAATDFDGDGIKTMKGELFDNSPTKWKAAMQAKKV